MAHHICKTVSKNDTHEMPNSGPSGPSEQRQQRHNDGFLHYTQLGSPQNIIASKGKCLVNSPAQRRENTLHFYP